MTWSVASSTSPLNMDKEVESQRNHKQNINHVKRERLLKIMKYIILGLLSLVLFFTVANAKCEFSPCPPAPTEVFCNAHGGHFYPINEVMGRCCNECLCDPAKLNGGVFIPSDPLNGNCCDDSPDS
ncbi:hypothetical protein PPL_02781 [Heterostelium album PN500]|uniref:Uncharacterized protein n=1 Tax=Heterostelium pallidum (strain ATCC 26659 / Pp 5 / PN500) TaxID=670386 RepID=D3B316_HETP5|nr:hypothetical protein PPL_02781 [Heterostelium album PN500]EFA83714.1 hypothetical protein PPL_02781 [Heterostelium album PN500]|eukprot:XP_020435831.1 hypothetical protein PPL_02781 [Heterostelium album PN500]